VLKLTELPTVFGDIGMTLRNHLSTVTPDLLVMGAYAHSRLFQFVLGGVTDSMVGDATLPVLYSH
jgi:nucleotide-binding universal stress UspA family protein